MGAEEMKIPRIGSLLKGVYQLVGRKGLYEEEEQGSLSGKERMHILETVIFWETDLSLILGDYPQNILLLHD